jgi:hypothetical protein
MAPGTRGRPAVCDIGRVPLTVPTALARNVTENWGDSGVRWLAALPALLGEVARDRRLTIGAPYPLSSSEVWSAQGGTPGSRALDVATMLLPRLSG